MVIQSQDSNQDSILVDNIVITGLDEEKRIHYSSIPIDSIDMAPIPRMENYAMFIPGMEMQSGALNTNRISIRGIGSRSPFATSKIRVYLDDIPLTDGVGETTLEDINLASLGSIEVYKGPTTSLYGSALGGTMVLNTSFNKIAHQPLLRHSLMIGSYGTWRSDTHFSKKWNDNHLTYANLEYLSSDGYRENNNYKKWTGTLYHKWKVKNDFWSFFIQGIDLKAQIPSSISLDDYEANPRKAAPNWQAAEGNEDNQKLRIGISYNHTINNENAIVLTGYTNLFNGYEIRPFNVLDDQATTLGGRFRYLLAKKKWNIILGQEIYLEDYNWDIFEINGTVAGDKLSTQESNRFLSNTFGQAIYKFTPAWSVVAGINVNRTKWKLLNIDSGLTTESQYNWQVNPTLSLVWQFHPMVDNSVTIGRGFSTPSIDESLDATGQFLPDLSQESGWNYEWQLTYNNSNKWEIKSQIFYTQVNDLLVNQRDPVGETFAINAGQTSMYGWEPSLLYTNNFSPSQRLVLRANASVGRYVFEEFLDNNMNHTGNDLTGVAPTKWTLFAEYSSSDFYINTTGRYVSSIPINDANTVYSDRYFLQWLTIGKHFHMNKIKGQLSLYIENLYNTKYASMLGVNARGFGSNSPRYFYPGRERNYSLKVSLSI